MLYQSLQDSGRSFTVILRLETLKKIPTRDLEHKDRPKRADLTSIIFIRDSFLKVFWRNLYELRASTIQEYMMGIM